MSPHTANVVIFFSSWFLAAFAVGLSGGLRDLPRPVLQIALATLTLLLLVLCTRWQSLRQWCAAVSLRSLILFHVCRFVGLSFLQWHAAGKLPYEFAVPAAWGDCAVAATALLVAFLPLRQDWARAAVAAWNTLALLDILMVVAIAAWLGFSQPMSILALAILPLCMLPLFLVPLIIVCHCLIYARLSQTASTRARLEAP